MKTKAQDTKKRLAAMLFGVQLLENAVRKMASDLGHPLPSCKVALPEWEPVLPGRAGGGLGMAKSGGPTFLGERIEKRGCALVGCRKPNRTKGYCGAHYQKLRMLEKTGRRPAAWADYATPGTVQDVKLPRGRAGSKLLAEQRAAQAKKAVRK